MSNYQRFILSSSESQEYNLVRHPGSHSPERTMEVPRGGPPSLSSGRQGTMCGIVTNFEIPPLTFFSLQESSQSRLCRRAAWLYANSILIWWFKPGYGGPSSNKAEGVSTTLINFRKHLYSPRSFQHSEAGSARDKLPTRRQPTYRCTSCVYPSVIPCQLIYKLSNTSACSNIRAPPVQSDLGLKSFVLNKTIQSSPQMATHHSTHPLLIILPAYLHSPPSHP